MKAVICIAVWKRPKIFELVYKRFNQIREWSETDIDIYLAGDENDPCKEIFEKHKQKGDRYFIHANKPLGKKLNSIYDKLRDIEFDYAVTCGSDDMISDKAWKLFELQMYAYKYHFIGTKEITLVDSDTLKCGHYKKLNSKLRYVGCYRFLHKILLNKLMYEPYDSELSSGLDYSMEIQMINFTGLQEKAIEVGFGGIVDLKSTTNIHSFKKLERFTNLVPYKYLRNEIKELCQDLTT